MKKWFVTTLVGGASTGRKLSRHSTREEAEARAEFYRANPEDWLRDGEEVAVWDGSPPKAAGLGAEAPLVSDEDQKARILGWQGFDNG